MRILNVFLEIGEDLNSRTEFIEIPVSDDKSQKIKEKLKKQPLESKPKTLKRNS